MFALTLRNCIIGASRSEPHTSDFYRDFSFIYNILYIYLPSVISYIPVVYFNDMQYFILLRACSRHRGHKPSVRDREQVQTLQRRERASSLSSYYKRKKDWDNTETDIRKRELQRLRLREARLQRKRSRQTKPFDCWGPMWDSRS